ncbi:hypothetical protein MY4824_009227 [Beauveria thailandica]
MHSDIHLNIEERLAQMTNTLAQEPQKLQCKTNNDFEVKMAALKGGFTQEKEVSRCLQAELQSIAARLSAIETKIEDHAKISAQLGNLAQQESFVKPDEASSSRWAAVKKSSYKAAHKFPVEDLEATLEKRTLFMDIYEWARTIPADRVEAVDRACSVGHNSQ